MSDRYNGILLEEIRDELKSFRESMAGIPQDVSQLKVDVAQLKTDVRTIIAVVTDQSLQLGDHEGRITTLEKPKLA